MAIEDDVYPWVFKHLENMGWNTADTSQVARKVKVNGREADLVLYDNKREPLAVIELKRDEIDPYTAKLQAKEYASKLGAPFVFLTNGEEIFFWELNTGFDAHLVKEFFTQEDLIRKRYLLQNRKDLGRVRIDPTIVGGVKNDKDWNFQIECIHAICDGLKKHRRRMLVGMATGTGKTRTMAAIIKRLQRAGWINNVLFVVDRETLANQALGVFNRFIGDYGYIFKGEILEEKRITVSIINTMANHYEDFSPGYFDLIITDECHRSIYHKWRDVLLYFDGIHIGLTATPASFIDRNTYRYFHCDDGRPTFSFPLTKGIEKGVLVPYEIYKATTQITRDGLHWDGEDYSPYDLERKITVPERNEKIVQEFKEKSRFAKTLIFAATKRHASTLTRLFNRAYSGHGDNVAIDITTDTRRPDQAIKEFKENPFPMIAVSVGMLDTGFDYDEVENLVFARPIRSPILYQQMRGRGTRTCDRIGKTHFTIYDFCGNADYFNDPGYDPAKYRAGTPLEVTEPKSRERYGLKTADVPDFIVERGWIYFTPGQEKVDVKSYLIDFESRMKRMVEYNNVLERLLEGIEPSEEEIRELMVELNQEGYTITEDALKMIYNQPTARMLDFIKHVLDIEKLPDREKRINDAFTNYLISHDFTPEQVRFLTLIKNTFLTKGKCTYEDFSRPPLKTEGGLDLGEKLFPHEFDNVFNELTKEVLA